MAKLIHEVWMDAEGLPGICLAGPQGDGARAMFGAGAKLVHRITAELHFDAMCLYNRFLGREPYESDFESDREAYSDDLAATEESVD
jgi:hypothetical protein